MDIKNLLINALGMQTEEVVFENFEMNTQDLTLSITLRQQRKSCTCPECHKPLYGIKQWKKRKLWGIPLGIFHKVEVVFYQLQGACGECLKHRLAFSRFIHPRFKQMTTAFSEYCGRWMEETTCAAVERMTGCPSMSLWRLDQWRMKEMKRNFTLPDELPVSLMSADEVHMYTHRPPKTRFDKGTWDKKFITNLVSYDLSKVITNARGRSARTLQSCFKQLGPELCKKIKFIAVDMHDGFIKAAAMHCPNAKIAVDRFHVAQALNEAFDEVRKSELEKAKQDNDLFQKEMLMPSKKFILTEKKKDLSKNDQSRLEKLRKLNQNIHTAMLLMEYFHRILDKTKIKDFRSGVKLWEELVVESKLIPFTDFLKTVKKYQERIETYISSRLTTAVSEGLNNKIKVLKRVGYTYTNQESFQNKILQRCGLLNSRNIGTNHWFFEIKLGTQHHPTN